MKERKEKTTTLAELFNSLVANPLDSAGTAWTRRPRDATSETNVRSMVPKGGTGEEGLERSRGRAEVGNCNFDSRSRSSFEFFFPPSFFFARSTSSFFFACCLLLLSPLPSSLFLSTKRIPDPQLPNEKRCNNARARDPE